METAMASKLDQLRSMTVVVADTGDIEAVRRLKPQVIFSSRRDLIFGSPSLFGPLPTPPLLAAGLKSTGEPNLGVIFTRSCEECGLLG
jgi:hypothetical protein